MRLYPLFKCVCLHYCYICQESIEFCNRSIRETHQNVVAIYIFCSAYQTIIELFRILVELFVVLWIVNLVFWFYLSIYLTTWTGHGSHPRETWGRSSKHNDHGLNTVSNWSTCLFYVKEFSPDVIHKNYQKYLTKEQVTKLNRITELGRTWASELCKLPVNII